MVLPFSHLCCILKEEIEERRWLWFKYNLQNHLTNDQTVFFDLCSFQISLTAVFLLIPNLQLLR